MEIDTEVPLSPTSGPDPGFRTQSGEVDKTSNGIVVASTEIIDHNGGADDGIALASPNHGISTSQLQQPYGFVPARDTSEPMLDSRVKSASPAEAMVSSEDELVDGEVAWTTPIVPPKLLATGLCYDVRMRYHCELDPPKQRLDFHPEDPRRIYHIYRELCQAGLCRDPQFNVPTIDKPLQRIRARDATAPEICLVHTPNHYHFVAGTAGKRLPVRER